MNYCKSDLRRKVAYQNFSYDSSKIAIIPFRNQALFGEMDSINTYATLTQNDLIELEKLFRESVAEHDSAINTNKEKGEYIDLKKWDYKRQYVGYINKRGQKIVYVNCFCDTTGLNYWRKDLVEFNDGGDCFFHLKINLITKKWFDFIVNGYA